MTYKIGARVKKVRGTVNVGVTAVVCSGPTVTGGTLEDSKHGADMYVKPDQPVRTYTGRIFPAGVVSMSDSRYWDPIIPDGHRPGIKDTCEPLDKLLSEVRHASA